MTDEEINAFADKIRALEPRTKETVLLFLDLLVQAQRNGQPFPEVQASNVNI